MSSNLGTAEARQLARQLMLEENKLLRDVLLNNRHIMMNKDGKHADFSFVWVRPKWDETDYHSNINILYGRGLGLVSETRRAQERKDVVLIIVRAPHETLKAALRLIRHKVDLNEPTTGKLERVETSVDIKRLFRHPRPMRMVTS